MSDNLNRSHLYICALVGERQYDEWRDELTRTPEDKLLYDQISKEQEEKYNENTTEE